jgi:hypothetical protein
MREITNDEAEMNKLFQEARRLSQKVSSILFPRRGGDKAICEKKKSCDRDFQAVSAPPFMLLKSMAMFLLVLLIEPKC